MTVEEVLNNLKMHNDFTTNVAIVDSMRHYSGSIGYFLCNGAFGYLMKTEVSHTRDNIIFLKEED